MIEFLYKINEMLTTWQPDKNKSLEAISAQMNISIPHIIQYLSDVLDKEFDITDQLSFDEAMETFLILSRKLKPEIEEHEKKLAQEKIKASQLYEQLISRVSKMQIEKQWYQAFRSLTYFSGQKSTHLIKSTRIELCSEIVRSGIKASANIQEIGYWLQKAVYYAVEEQDINGFDEALDLLDAYAEPFLKEKSGQGAKLIQTILGSLENLSCKLERWEDYKKAAQDLFSP